MGLWIDRVKCTGCGSCVRICPGDLLFLDCENKVVLREQRDCWDCMACVKSCPEGVLYTKLPYSIGDYGASIRPFIEGEFIRWVCTNKNGEREEFLLRR